MEETVKIGANVSLTNLLELFETVQEDSLPYFPVFALHLRQVATNTIRNVSYFLLLLKQIYLAQFSTTESTQCPFQNIENKTSKEIDTKTTFKHRPNLLTIMQQ